MSTHAPEGWDEVFRGPCVEADLVQAILEARGLQVVAEPLGSESVFSGLAFEQCRLFVRSVDGNQAREILAEDRPESPRDGSDEGESIPP